MRTNDACRFLQFVAEIGVYESIAIDLNGYPSEPSRAILPDKPVTIHRYRITRMSISFITPAALVLLALLPLLWVFTILTPRRMASWRFWASLLIRSLLLLSLVLALAGAQLVRPAHDLTTV